MWIIKFLPVDQGRPTSRRNATQARVARQYTQTFTLPKKRAAMPIMMKTPTAKGTKNPPLRYASLTKMAARRLPPSPREILMT